MVETHRRVFIATILIEILANLATLGIYFSGTGSSELSLASIFQEIGAAVVIIALTYLVVSRNPTAVWSKYLVIFMVGLVTFMFVLTMSGSPEIFAVFYLVLALGVLYFDMGVCIFSTLLVVILMTAGFIINPGIIPEGSIGATIGVRYCLFIFVGIASGFTTSVARRLLEVSD